MTINNVSTYGSLQTLLQNMSQVQNELNTAQVQISSGQQAQTFDQLNGSVEQLTSINAQVSRLTNYQQNNSTYLSQLQTTNTSLGQMEQLATSIKSLMSQQMSGENSQSSFQQQIQSDQTALAAELNTTFGGDYLFSGTKTGTPPVKVPLPEPDTVGVPDDNYYQGSQQDTTTRVADGQVITNSVRADNPAFQQIFAGINQALQPSVSSGDLTNAENLVDQGIQGIIAQQATVNANIVNVQQVNTQSQTVQTYFTGLTQNMTQADVVSLSTQVAQDQNILEASFSTFARISSLTLANYLK